MADAYLDRQDQHILLADEEELKKTLQRHYRKEHKSNLFNHMHDDELDGELYIDALLPRLSNGFKQVALALPGQYTKIVWYNDTPVCGIQVGENSQFTYENDACEWITAKFSADLKLSKVYAGQRYLFVVYRHQVEWAFWDTGETKIIEIPNAASAEKDGDLYLAVGTEVHKFNPDSPDSKELVLTCDRNITQLVMHGDIVYAAEEDIGRSFVHVWSLSKEKKVHIYNVGNGHIIDMCVSAHVLCVRRDDRGLLLYDGRSRQKKVDPIVNVVCSCGDGTFFRSKYESVEHFGFEPYEETSLPSISTIVDMSVSQSGKLGIIAYGLHQQFLFVNDVKEI